MSGLGTIRLDLDRLVDEGRLSADEANRLDELSEGRDWAPMLVSILCIVGALMAGTGVVFLKPPPVLGLIIALCCLGSALLLQWRAGPAWSFLAQTLAIGAAVGLSGWFAMQFSSETTPMAHWSFTVAVVGGLCFLFRSGFLSAMVPLCLAGILGSTLKDHHVDLLEPVVWLFVYQPALSIMAFLPLASALYAYAWWKRENIFAPIARVAARMTVVLVNLGWWAGSILGKTWERNIAAVDAIDRIGLTLGWAGFAVAMIVIGSRASERFAQIAGVVFLALNAITQYVVFVDREPTGMIAGGIVMICVAVAIVCWQMRQIRKAIP